MYVEVARSGFRRYATYRGATIGGLVTNVVWGFMRGYVLLALVRARGEVGGYDARDAITYIWLTQALIMVIEVWGRSDIPERIRTGDIVTDLYRPLDFQGYWLAQDIGRACFQALARGIPPMAVGAFFFDLRFPSPGRWVLFGVSLALAVIVAFAGRFIVNLTAFWLLDANGLNLAYGLCANFLSGFIIPIGMFPDLLRNVSLALPFSSMLMTPIDVFVGRAQGTELVVLMALQVFWAVALLAGGRVLVAVATRKVVVQGG